MSDFDESMGVNDRVALARANKIMRKRINTKLMESGVTMLDPETTYIDDGVQIGQDTVIEGGVVIKGKTTIGNECYISAHSRIEDSTIHDGVTITSSTLQEAEMHDGSDIGPNSHLRPAAEIGKNVHIGNFCEVKKAFIGEGTKVGHLTYIGNATLGKDINVGCGVVFVNYDGKNKHHTNVGDHAFIGSTVTWLPQLIWLPMRLLQRAPQLRTMLKNMIWQLPGHVRLIRKITLRNLPW